MSLFASCRRAAPCCLVLDEKAEVLHADGEVMHSEHLSLDVPSVIRLRYFVRVPFQRRCTLSRRAVFARDDHRCQYCGGHADSIDHVMPRSRGGQHVWENVVAACRACNIRKRDRLLEETTMHLARRPVGAEGARVGRRDGGSSAGALGSLPRVPHLALCVTWAVERLTGSATELHWLETFPIRSTRAVWILEATAPALVLGSTQPWIDVTGARGVSSPQWWAARSSFAPSEVLWIDVLLPRGDPLWDDDVGRAAYWLGETWCDALGVGVVHTGPLVRTTWSDQICFAGVGPGEVLVDGAKVVGISQRRTRAGARFQCAVMRTWDPTELARIFGCG